MIQISQCSPRAGIFTFGVPVNIGFAIGALAKGGSVAPHVVKKLKSSVPVTMTMKFAVRIATLREIKIMPETGFRCWKCHSFVRAEFTFCGGTMPSYPNKAPGSWIGVCPSCGEQNWLTKPSWTKKYIADKGGQ